MNQSWIELPTGPGGRPMVLSWRHIGRHFRGSGTLGATITKWQGVEEFFRSPEIQAFLQEIAGKLDPNEPGVQKFCQVFPFSVGLEGIIRKDEIPEGCRVWEEDREGYSLTVTDAPAPETRQLCFLFGQKPDAWLIISVWAGSKDSRPLTDTDWWADWAFYDIR